MRAGEIEEQGGEGTEAPGLRPFPGLPLSTRDHRCVTRRAPERSRSPAVLVSYRRVSTQARKKNEPKAASAPIKSGPGQERRGRRESRVDQAYAEIRRRILDNHYAPGHHVLEQELAADLGMSRTPVREALVRLQNERFVQLIPRHGMRVVPLSIQDLREVYEVLTSLELTAIDRLARLDLEEEALTTIEKTVDEMDLAVRKKDVDAWAKADERFHRMLVTLCGNHRLAAAMLASPELFPLALTDDVSRVAHGSGFSISTVMGQQRLVSLAVS